MSIVVQSICPIKYQKTFHVVMKFLVYFKTLYILKLLFFVQLMAIDTIVSIVVLQPNHNYKMFDRLRSESFFIYDDFNYNLTHQLIVTLYLLRGTFDNI